MNNFIPEDEVVAKPHEDELTKEQEATAETNAEPKEKVKIEFPFSDKVRSITPKAFEVAENVATQWKNDEKFEVGLSHPLAEVAAVKALEKAKEVEKKLEEKGVITAAKWVSRLLKFKRNHYLQKLKRIKRHK